MLAFILETKGTYFTLAVSSVSYGSYQQFSRPFSFHLM